MSQTLFQGVIHATIPIEKWNKASDEEIDDLVEQVEDIVDSVTEIIKSRCNTIGVDVTVREGR